jgi:hypothetical protein
MLLLFKLDNELSSCAGVQSGSCLNEIEFWIKLLFERAKYRILNSIISIIL